MYFLRQQWILTNINHNLKKIPLKLSQYKDVTLLIFGIPMIKIAQSYNHLIFIMVIHINKQEDSLKQQVPTNTGSENYKWDHPDNK